MVITTGDVLTFLYILVGIMLVVVLYNVLQLFVDVRRIVKRADRLTEKVESIILKPLAIADEVLGNVMALFEGRGKKERKGFDHKKVH
ncbi:MAG: CASP domain-containing protein [Candidatus Peribacteraceae bacterium]|jgi:hypothetical protein